jgi:hypothetical protein
MQIAPLTPAQRKSNDHADAHREAIRRAYSQGGLRGALAALSAITR